MQQIYRRTPMPKCDFNKVVLQRALLFNSSWNSATLVFKALALRSHSSNIFINWFFLFPKKCNANKNCLKNMNFYLNFNTFLKIIWNTPENFYSGWGCTPHSKQLLSFSYLKNCLDFNYVYIKNFEKHTASPLHF